MDNRDRLLHYFATPDFACARCRKNLMARGLAFDANSESAGCRMTDGEVNAEGAFVIGRSRRPAARPDELCYRHCKTVFNIFRISWVREAVFGRLAEESPGGIVLTACKGTGVS
jgi:hypothetical protein